MKRFTVSIIVLLIVAISAVAGANELPLIFSDDFEAGPLGEPPKDWVVVPRGNTPDTPYVTDVQAYSGGYSLRLGRERENSHISNGVAYFFAPLRERAEITFRFYAEDMDRSLVMVFAGEEQGTNLFGAGAGGFLVLRAAALQAYFDDAFYDAAIYEPQRWHFVRIEVDIPAGTYVVYMDDEEEPMHLDVLKFRNPEVSNIAGIGFGFQGASATSGLLPVYIDDVTVRGK